MHRIEKFYIIHLSLKIDNTEEANKLFENFVLLVFLIIYEHLRETEK